jgi:hypothetical protein
MYVANLKSQSMQMREKLFEKIFIQQHYNKMIRPSSGNDNITHITIELKLLQIDLDEKYQELISTGKYKLFN